MMELYQFYPKAKGDIMPLETKWRVEFETIEPIGDVFIEGVIMDGVGKIYDSNKYIAENIKVTCLRELTKKEYKKYDEEMENWRKGHGITN